MLASSLIIGALSAVGFTQGSITPVGDGTIAVAVKNVPDTEVLEVEGAMTTLGYRIVSRNSTNLDRDYTLARYRELHRATIRLIYEQAIDAIEHGVWVNPSYRAMHALEALRTALEKSDDPRWVDQRIRNAMQIVYEAQKAAHENMLDLDQSFVAIDALLQPEVVQSLNRL